MINHYVESKNVRFIEITMLQSDIEKMITKQTQQWRVYWNLKT